MPIAPRWDAAAPWQSQDEHDRFKAFMMERYASKQAPDRYVAKIICSIAQGQPCVDWDDFRRGDRAFREGQKGQSAGVQDWGKFPRYREWLEQIDQQGEAVFAASGPEYSLRLEFVNWYFNSGKSVKELLQGATA